MFRQERTWTGSERRVDDGLYLSCSCLQPGLAWPVLALVVLSLSVRAEGHRKQSLPLDLELLPCAGACLFTVYCLLGMRGEHD